MNAQPIDKNNFDGVRIGLAIIVVFAHLAALTGSTDFTSIAAIFNADMAVKGFFAISGFLVMKSYSSSSNLSEYAEKRLRRIYPAYLAAILLCVVIAICTTRFSTLMFSSAADTWKYIASNAFFLNFLQPTLPGTFTENPVQTMNGTLWTIKVEIMLYACIPLMAWLFNRVGALKTTIVMLLLSAGWIYYFTTLYQGTMGAEIARQFPGQLAYFAVGALVYASAKTHYNLHWLAGISLCLFLIIDNPIARLVIDPVCYATVVIYLCTRICKNLHLGKYGDISYGIYLYHFPIIQLLVQMGAFEQSPWLGLALTFTCTLAAAFLSWHLIEKRWLKRSSYYLLAAKAA